MIQKEISELRKRFTNEKNCISKIYGCYVNKNKEIISKIDSSLALLPTSESEKFLSLFHKSLSGTMGKNLIDIEFSTNDVTDGEHHKLLMTLRDSELADEEAREKLFKAIIDSVSLDDKGYVVLLGLDKYDVPFRGKEGEAMEITESISDSVFKYIICAICPVNEGKTELGYFAKEREFHSTTSPKIVGTTELGFIFPAFDNRATNIYGALMYSKDSSYIRNEFIDAVFNTEPVMSAKEQKNTFNAVLNETLEEACSFDVVQAVHEQIREKIEDHKESRTSEPLELDSNDVANILLSSGVAAEKVEEFKTKCNESFGKKDSLNPNNIIDAKKFEIVTPQVKITVDPDYTYTLKTEVINGIKYILIPAEDGVSVNGVDITIEE